MSEARVVQITDTHVVRAGEGYLGCDPAAYLAETIAFVNAMEPQPLYVVVTGDLVNTGDPAEYARFGEVMGGLRAPYFAVPGNHDERAAFRANLPEHVYGAAKGERIRYVVDDFPVRLVGLDANVARPWIGASLDAESLDWVEATLASEPQKPTILAVHQPPFRTGLHYFDIFGYGGARRLRRIVDASPQVGRVLSGHIHCVKTYRWKGALVASAPSAVPQFVPELFEHRIFGVRRELPGFAVIDWQAERGFSSTVFRREAAGVFIPGAPQPLATRR